MEYHGSSWAGINQEVCIGRLSISKASFVQRCTNMHPIGQANSGGACQMLETLAAESAAVSCCLLYPLISRMQAGWCRMQAQERFGMFGDSSLPACRCSVSSCALHNTSGTWLNTFHNHVRWPPELAATCLAQFRKQNAQFYRYIERKQTNSWCSLLFYLFFPDAQVTRIVLSNDLDERTQIIVFGKCCAHSSGPVLFCELLTFTPCGV